MNPEADTTFATDAEPSVSQNQFRTIPLWLTLGGGILVVCLILFLIWLARSSEHPLPPESLLAVETQTDAPIKQAMVLKSAPATPAAMHAVDDPDNPPVAVLQTAAPAAAHDQTTALTQAIASAIHTCMGLLHRCLMLWIGPILHC